LYLCLIFQSYQQLGICEEMKEILDYWFEKISVKLHFVWHSFQTRLFLFY
jgi:uncharacterized protein Usg